MPAHRSRRSLPVLLAALAVVTLPAVPAIAADGEPATCPVDVTAPAQKRGRILYLQCVACHALERDEPGKVGPHLLGLYLRPAGSVPGFAYSRPLAEAGFAWDRDRLDAFLRAPQELVPGSIMAFAGIPRDSDRQALVDYLVAATTPACAAR